MMKEKISPVCVNKRAVTVRLCSGDSLKNNREFIDNRI
ncbi:hypothetical protein HMPREF9406_2801 [Clostridium sp. HGF2]|nr:hypothetical protein HMPREF9406_2801 [Clostridium sp. HGF2]